MKKILLLYLLILSISTDPYTQGGMVVLIVQITTINCLPATHPNCSGGCNIISNGGFDINYEWYIDGNLISSSTNFSHNFPQTERVLSMPLWKHTTRLL